MEKDDQQSSANDSNRSRNNKKVQQQHNSNSKNSSKIINEHDYFLNLGLTKRNAEYMFKFREELQKSDIPLNLHEEIISKMVAELKVKQHNGVKANRLYGSPTQRLKTVINEINNKPATFNVNDYWHNAIYNIILFFVIFSFFYGITTLTTKSTPKMSVGEIGIVGVVISSLVIGLGVPIMSKLFQPGVTHRFSFWERLLIFIFIIGLWALVFYLESYIPINLNAVLPSWLYFVLAIIGSGLLYLIRKNWEITSSIFFKKAN